MFKFGNALKLGKTHFIMRWYCKNFHQQEYKVYPEYGMWEKSLFKGCSKCDVWRLEKTVGLTSDSDNEHA